MNLSYRAWSAIGGLACALALGALAAGEAAAFPAPPSRETIAPFVLLEVRQDCSTERRGNEVTTYYCEDGDVCSGPKTCTAGPEKLRAIEEEQRKLAEEIRGARGTERQVAGNLMGQGGYANQGRGSGCQSTISMPGDAPRPCVPGPSGLSENVYNLSGGLPRVYVRPPPPTRPPVRSSTSIRQNLRFALAVAPLVEALGRLQPNDPTRAYIEQQIDGLAEAARQQGIDSTKALGGLNYRKGSTTPPASAGPPPPTVPDAPAPTTPATAPAVVEAPPASDSSAVSSKDEVLCSYLLTLEPSKPGSLPVQVPEYCKPYLQSIGRPTTPQPDPLYIGMDSRDIEEIRLLKKEVEDLDVMPPGMVE